MVDNILLKAIKTPNGMPIARDSITEINTMEIVVIVSGHKSNDPIRNINIPKSIPPEIFVKYQPNAAIIMMSIHQGINNNPDSNPFMEEDVITNIKSKNA